ncbi:MAG: gliding motility-associated C-terminal domain-containing protein, partial [Flavobacteriales bacterium]
AGCAFTDSISVSVLPVPMLDLGPDQGLCPGSTLQLTANAPSLLWDDGSSASTRTIDQPGTYWAMATDNGCSASDTVIVTNVPLPNVHLGPDTGLCATAVLHLNATVPGGTYLWNDGLTDAERSVPAGTWSVAVSALGCTATDSIRIIPLPSPTLALPNDTTLCSGETWLIDVAQPGSSYLWSNGSTSPSLLVSAPDTYGVTVDRNGCLASAIMNVAYVDLSGFSLGPDTVLCPGETLMLAVSVPGVSVAWQDGSIASQRTISTAGTYSANISAGACTAHDEVHIGFTPLLEPDLGGNRSLCVGDTVLLMAPSGLAQAVWNNGTTGEALIVTSTGTYSVAFSLDGCVTRDTAHIIFLPVITQLDLGPDLRICPGSPLTLDATIPGASYLWNDGSHRSTLLVDRPGIYHVTAQGPCILASDTVLITEGSCAPEVYIPNAFTPDGDDINDSFAPVVSEPVRSWSFSIFNRWGAMIFSTEVPGAGWDGKVNGVEAPVGIYVWDLHYGTVTDAGVVQKRLRGSVALVR